MQKTDPETADYFFDFLEISLGDTPAGQKLREIMSFVSYFPGRGTVRETAYLEGKAEGKSEGKAEGKAEGEAGGEAKGLRQPIVDLCDVFGIELDDGRKGRLERLDVGGLDALRQLLKQEKRWPD